MAEGRDRPTELPSDQRNKRTAALLLQFCDIVKVSGRIVILDIVFCVLEGLIELRKMGIYANALIKKLRHWPNHVPGDLID